MAILGGEDETDSADRVIWTSTWEGLLAAEAETEDPAEMVAEADEYFFFLQTWADSAQ